MNGLVSAGHLFRRKGLSELTFAPQARSTSLKRALESSPSEVRTSTNAITPLKHPIPRVLSVSAAMAVSNDPMENDESSSLPPPTESRPGAAGGLCCGPRGIGMISCSLLKSRAMSVLDGVDVPSPSGLRIRRSSRCFGIASCRNPFPWRRGCFLRRCDGKSRQTRQRTISPAEPSME